VTTVITGGAGFIGTNLAHRLLASGEDVVIFDSLVRRGVERNLQWLRKRHPRLDARIADVRDVGAVRAALRDAETVVHLAGQVAVTTSLEEPLRDFSVNVGGTVNVLERVREVDQPPTVVFTSTNKVYGRLGDVPLVREGRRYAPADPAVRASGIGEDRPLQFLSPYGCSKGAADQYVLDHASTFGHRAVVLRMSCIYGPHQHGSEDQGWVCHFLMSALRGDPITIFGDGHQVRDVLFVDDLVTCLTTAARGGDDVLGRAFNIGGGPANTVSLLEAIGLIEHVLGRHVEVEFGLWRPGDHRYYVSDVRRFSDATGWRPETGPAEGIERLRTWLVEAGFAPAAHRPRLAAPPEEVGVRATPRTMRAVVLEGRQTFRVERVALPQPGAGEVRFRVEGCGVCGSDLPLWVGRSWFEYPHHPGAPGHEAWGVVDAVGEGVDEIQPGDRVAALSYRGFAEYDVARATDLALIPPALVGAAIPAEALGCAVSAIARSGIGPGDQVCVIGVGFIGAVMTRLAVAAGARVMAVGRRPFALEVAQAQGASVTITLSGDGGAAARIAEVTDGRLCDVVIEATGLQEPLDLAARSVREDGRLVLAGFHQDGLRTVDMCSWNWRALDIVNAHERDPGVRTDAMRRAIAAAAAGTIDLSTLGIRSWSLGEVEEAFAALSDRPDGFLKGIVRP
jgi:CDP-paratose 2-epimerase